jgi:hypothetical protein
MDCIRVIVLENGKTIKDIMESQVIGYTKNGKYDWQTQKFFDQLIIWTEDAKRCGDTVFVEMVKRGGGEI